MAELPVISGRKAARAFERTGWRIARRESSHIVMTKAGSVLTLSIPDHRELDRGLLRSQIRKAGITVDEFVELLKRK
ncbi:MAG: type II toxin-antitoxin system HicA family toxin [Dehalococcoidia bacterium]|nr:type II toxin-antitoxin system HicA family toxin [Dehalococcoidia bacterium]